MKKRDRTSSKQGRSSRLNEQDPNQFALHFAGGVNFIKTFGNS